MTDWAAARRDIHLRMHGLLRSQAKCKDCDYVAPMDGPDRIVAALDRLTAAVDRLAKAGYGTDPA